jgi:prepilin-type processing-associated H-X9-DG protein
MNTFLAVPERPRKQAGFTRLELLMVVMVLVALAVVRLSAATGMKNQTKIGQCAANLRQLGVSMLLYGSDNADKLPSSQSPSGGIWLWDLPWFIGNTLNQYGASQQLMYCPGTAPRFSATDNQNLYNWNPGYIHVIGYGVTLPGSPSLASTNVNYVVTPQPIQSGATLLPPPRASQRVLNADANLSSGGSYVAIFGGYQVGGRPLPHLCPHLDGFVPAGGNLGMLDGHVEWRSFPQMRLRTTGGAAPLFYW